MGYVFLAMRPHQWLKNLFVFLPLVFGQQLFNSSALLNSLRMFISFCMIASAVYLVNDILDLEEDRRHPEKRNRPLASGKLSRQHALALALLLCAVSFCTAFTINIYVVYILLGYVGLNYLYMKFLKEAVIIDVFCIGTFFYLRVLAGGLASGVKLSLWITMCTTLLALFLGFNKRRYDIEVLKDSRTVFLKYNVSFLDRMISIVSSTIIVAYALYAMDPINIQKVGSNHLIYTIPFVYYGIFRYLYVIDQKRHGGDPARILLKDYKLQVTLIVWLVVCVAVVYFKL